MLHPITGDGKRSIRLDVTALRRYTDLREMSDYAGPSAVYETLRIAGIDPAPRRRDPTWRQFLHAQAAGILVVDFLHVDTVLLKRLYVLVFIEHGTRRMHLGGVTANPTGEWTVQQARNLAISLGERFQDLKFVFPALRRSDHKNASRSAAGSGTARSAGVAFAHRAAGSSPVSEWTAWW